MFFFLFFFFPPFFSIFRTKKQFFFFFFEFFLQKINKFIVFAPKSQEIIHFNNILFDLILLFYFILLFYLFQILPSHAKFTKPNWFSLFILFFPFYFIYLIYFVLFPDRNCKKNKTKLIIEFINNLTLIIKKLLSSRSFCCWIVSSFKL